MRSLTLLALLSLSVFTAPLAVGCSTPDATSDAASESDYTGASGTEVVKADGSNLPANLRALRGAFAKVRYSVSFDEAAGACTGTHIGNGLVLTAGHCFRREWETGMVYRRTPRESEDRPFARITVTFEDGKSWDATMLDWSLTMQQDYAILRLPDGAQPSASVPLRKATTSPAFGTKLTMLSYPDKRSFNRREGMVDETTLIWSKYCTYDDASGEEDRYGMIDVTHGHFAHQCESEPGSSGAAVIDATTLEVVGVHNGELTASLYATKLDEIPARQYVEKLAEPAAKLNVVQDDDVSSDKSADATVDVAAATVESVAFELVDNDPKFTMQAPAQAKVTSAPFSAHFDTSLLNGPHRLRAIVKAKNGASVVLEDVVAISHH